MRRAIEDIRMGRQDILKLIKQSKPVLQVSYGVTRQTLFGSPARDGATEEANNVDVLVDFDGPATSVRYFGVQFYLEDLIGRPVDLVKEKALRPELCPYIKQEQVRV
jgi:predicted nucleotidyltransferase